MNSKEALEKIIKHPAWNYAAIHGMNKVDNELVEAFNIIKEELDGAERSEYYWQEIVNELQNRLQENQRVLDQYKTLEDELGVDLNTIFKALKNGAYFDDGYDSHTNCISLVHDGKEWTFDFCWKIKDYGKTWALTKEELE